MQGKDPGAPKIGTHIRRRRVQYEGKQGFSGEQRSGLWAMDLGFIREFGDECIQREELLETFGWPGFIYSKETEKRKFKKKKEEKEYSKTWRCSFEPQTS